MLKYISNATKALLQERTMTLERFSVYKGYIYLNIVFKDFNDTVRHKLFI